MLRNSFRLLLDTTPTSKFTIAISLFSHSTKMSNNSRSSLTNNTHHYDRERKIRDDQISRKLTYILRHGAFKMHLFMNSAGFVYVYDITKRIRVKERDIIRIVQNNNKQRFHLQTDRHGDLMIRANQGHTIECEDLQLIPITNANLYPCVVHGTTYQAWRNIRRTGLKTMGRTHIHFASGEPGEKGVISGMRNNSTVLIYINLEKALRFGIRFFVSQNNVILSKGDENNTIDPYFFKAVIDRKTRKRL